MGEPIPKGLRDEAYSGTMFNPITLRPCEVRLDDIAHALAQKPCYLGHGSQFYSIAQHCVNFSEIVEPDQALYALLSVSFLAYMPNLPPSMKPQMKGWNEIIMHVLRTVREGLNVPRRLDVTKEMLEKLDRLIVTERQYLGLTPKKGVEPLAMRLEGWDWRFAEQQFLQRYADITRGKL